MSALKFDEDGKRLYFTGVDHCVLFTKKKVASQGQAYDEGVAWNGISNATVTPEGGDVNDIYADNIKYLSIPGNVNINASITAYTYPDEFNACMGLASVENVAGLLYGQQERSKFGLVYRSKIGSDNTTDYGYVLNVLYNCLATPSELSSDTVNESPEAAELSFDISTTPVSGDDMPDGLKATSWVRIECKPGGLLGNDGTETANLKALLEYLYGRDADSSASPAVTAQVPTLLKPAEIYKILKDGSLN